MRARGYILAETLVALAIVALMLGWVLTSLHDSVRAEAAALETRRALLVARSALATIGSITPAQPGAYGGQDAGIDWRLDVEPAGAAGAAGTLARVTVTAGPRGTPARVRLTELLILGPPR